MKQIFYRNQSLKTQRWVYFRGPEHMKGPEDADNLPEGAEALLSAPKAAKEKSAATETTCKARENLAENGAQSACEAVGVKDFDANKVLADAGLDTMSVSPSYKEEPKVVQALQDWGAQAFPQSWYAESGVEDSGGAVGTYA